MNVESLLLESARRTGDSSAVEPIDDELLALIGVQFCYYGANFGSTDFCRSEATHTIEGTPYCDEHTAVYLQRVLAPFREIEDLLAKAADNDLNANVIVNTYIDTTRRCHNQCPQRPQYSIEGVELCLDHAVPFLKELFGIEA